MFHLPFCDDHGGAAVLCEWHKVHEILLCMGWMVVCGGVSAAEGEVEWKVRGPVESLAGTGGICFLILPLLFMQ